MFKKILIGLFIQFLVVGAFWVAGFDFDERGPKMFACYIFCIVAFYVPWIKVKEGNDLPI